MEKHILTKEQREAGLDTHEDDHNLYITDTATGETVAVLGNHATIKEIHIAANYYLIEKARGHNGNSQA